MFDIKEIEKALKDNEESKTELDKLKKQKLLSKTIVALREACPYIIDTAIWLKLNHLVFSNSDINRGIETGKIMPGPFIISTFLVLLGTTFVAREFLGIGYSHSKALVDYNLINKNYAAKVIKLRYKNNIKD